jgi:hypothetical protein
MAVRTISNTGGNFNSVGTWVGGVVPLTTDTINATATSGPLTINVASTCAGADFTNYVSTLAINFAFNISGPIVLVNTMTITGIEYLTASGTNTIRTNGLVIPYLRFVGQNTTRTLLDNITCINLLQTFGNQNPALAGSFTMSVSNFRTSTTGGGSYGWLNGLVPIVFNGDNCYYENILTQAGFTNHMIINTPGTFTISGTGSNSGIISLSTQNNSQGASSQLTYQSGTVVGQLNLSLYFSNHNNTIGIRLNTGSMSSNWNNIFIKDAANITAASNNLLNLTSPLRFNNIFLTGVSGINYTTARRPLRFIGTSFLEGGTFSAQSIMMNNLTTNIQSVLPADIQFTPNAGTTHSITNLNVIGLPDGKSTISSTTATKVGLSFSNVLLYTNLTGVEAPTLSYVYGGTFSNTINIATASFGGSGGGETSATFVN